MQTHREGCGRIVRDDVGTDFLLDGRAVLPDASASFPTMSLPTRSVRPDGAPADLPGLAAGALPSPRRGC